MVKALDDADYVHFYTAQGVDDLYQYEGGTPDMFTAHDLYHADLVIVVKDNKSTIFKWRQGPIQS